MKSKLSLIFSMLIINFGFAQSDYWQRINSTVNSLSESSSKSSLPNVTLFNLNVNKIKKTLQSTPFRETSFDSNTIIYFPNEKGEMESFKVYEASVLHPDLAAKYPEIKSYAGQGIENPTATIRFSISPYGLQSMRLSGTSKTVFIEPYDYKKSIYTIYSKDQKTIVPEKLNCLVDDNFNSSFSETISSDFRNANDGKLRTYRLALACTGEYAQFHLNNQGIDPNASESVKKGAVLSAMNATMTRVNGIFEIDLAITMIIVPNNTNVIFLDPETDNLSNDNSYTLINESQTVCDQFIGNSNYDIGHTFSTGGGGLAYLRSPCTDIKAKGITGSSKPIEDAYDVDYVAHEMGHQFGANHTQNNSCNRSTSSVEPGSASTIMGYAGICSPNVQPNSDGYFHAISIQEMWNNVLTGTGSSCGTLSNTGNSAPTADAGSDYTIPASTPFILKGEGQDVDAENALTYCWEQMNTEQAVMPPSPSSTKGPAFRSLTPTPSNKRYMPALPTVLNGSTASEWEVVPSVSRTMNFRLTVRDNAVGGASSASDNMIITVTDSAGPFFVSIPNTDVSWTVGSNQSVTWNVAGTTANGINAANIDILLSTDGGNTYPFALATAVPNDGSHDITVPNQVGSENRIMVRGSENIFYDISNTNFKIIGGSGDNQPPTTPTELTASNITETSVVLSWNPSTDNIGVTGYDVYQEENSTITVTDTTATITGLAANTVYQFRVKAKDAAGNLSDFSNTVQVTTTGGGEIVYCNANASSSIDEYISRVQLGSIDKNSLDSSTGYSDYTSEITDLAKGTSNTITITPAWKGTVYDEAYAVWIDYNKDGEFSDTEERVWSLAPSKTTPVSGVFTVPDSALDGTTRMRVIMRYNNIPSPCRTFDYGEVEDYTVNIITVPTCDDGIMNGDETGIDCGGSCEPCQAPVYCEANANTSAHEYISHVQLGSINNNSEGATGGYSDFTSITTNLSKGVSNTITITPIWVRTVYDEAYAVWIDYNQDGEFSDVEEQVWSQSATQTTPVSGNFTIPENALNGTTRMRVIMRYRNIPSSCGTFNYGEVEDYTIIIGDYSTCNDGIQNGDETGIDCGGSCPPCDVANGVVYVDIDDISVNATDYWNFFTIEVGDDKDYGAWFSNNSLRLVTYDKDIVCLEGSKNVSLIEEGKEVGASSNFVADPNHYIVSSSSYKDWNGRSGYIGFTFKVNGNTHYGWFYATVANDGLSYTISEYAYNTNAGQSLYTLRNHSKSSVVRKERTEKLISVYPNPFKSTTNINLTKLGKETFTISIYDILGKRIYEKEFVNNPEILSLGETITENGNYFVKIKSKTTTEVRALVKQ